jgi:hypothetical protein
MAHEVFVLADIEDTGDYRVSSQLARILRSSPTFEQATRAEKVFMNMINAVVSNVQGYRHALDPIRDPIYRADGGRNCFSGGDPCSLRGHLQNYVVRALGVNPSTFRSWYQAIRTFHAFSAVDLNGRVMRESRWFTAFEATQEFFKLLEKDPNQKKVLEKLSKE